MSPRPPPEGFAAHSDFDFVREAVSDRGERFPRISAERLNDGVEFEHVDAANSILDQRDELLPLPKPDGELFMYMGYIIYVRP